MNKPQVFKFDNLPPPVGIHVLSTHKEEEGIAISNELHQIVESRFESWSIPSSIVAEVGLLALETQARCCLDVLSTNGKRFISPSASLGRFPPGIRRCDKEVEIVASNGATSNQYSPLA
ncbi:hypothetical protein [Microbispora hainanensis]|uniref:hypothetical protein n=1 Tax=Microbispora hainanensis TaxID=568844 RepID=UPI00324D24F1